MQEAQYEAMKQRIRMMYLKGDTFYLDLLFSMEGSYGDMLNKAGYIEKIEEYDRNKLNDYMEQTRLVELTKESLEEEKVTLDEAKEAVEEEEANVKALLSEKEAQINAVNADIQTKEQSIAAYEADIAQRDAEIAALEKIIQEERARLAEEQRRKYDGGMFAWPCPGYSYISSEYGYRVHPIYGYQLFHNGVDMAASSGTPILAAYSGKVIAAAYSSSMGNYVMIDHGDGLITIYMHASALYVSSGQEVSRGEQIARERRAADEVVVDEHDVPRRLRLHLVHDRLDRAVHIASAMPAHRRVVAEVARERTPPARRDDVVVEAAARIHRLERRRQKRLSGKRQRRLVSRT